MISHALGPIIALPLPAMMYFLGFPLDYRLIVFSCAILAFWIYPFALRQFGHYRALAFVSALVGVLTNAMIVLVSGPLIDRVLARRGKLPAR